MPKVDVIDGVVIDAPPMAVFKAILNEYSGVTRFWMPIIEFKPRADKPMDCEGAICDVTARNKGIAAKFSVKVTKIELGKSDLELAGDLIGTETWTFEPVDGKTKLQIHWVGGTNRLLFSLLSPFASMEKLHSQSIQKGFEALSNSFFKK
jgi:hypothetical protein